MNQFDSTGSLDKTDMFTSSDLSQPDAASIIDLVSIDGTVWTNGNTCP